MSDIKRLQKQALAKHKRQSQSDSKLAYQIAAVLQDQKIRNYRTLKPKN